MLLLIAIRVFQASTLANFPGLTSLILPLAQVEVEGQEDQTVDQQVKAQICRMTQDKQKEGTRLTQLVTKHPFKGPWQPISSLAKVQTRR
jgi:hypothetical protein